MFLSEFFKKIFQNKILSALLLIASAIALGIVSLYFASEMTGTEIFNSYFETPVIAILNILPCIWLALFFWFLTRRTWLAFMISSIIVMGFSIANWFKLQFRNDPVMFGDILLIKEAANMSQRYKLYITQSMIAALLILISITVLLAIIARGKPFIKLRLIGIILLLISIIPLKSVYFSSDIYNNKTENNQYINKWSSTQVYISKGFVYPFLHSIQDAITQPPEKYDEEKTKELLDSYESADIPDNQKIDIVGIMMEAYADFSVYDQIQFENDPYTFFHELEDESISGNLYTNIFAGGTVNTERAFLTGFDDQGSFRSPTNSYAWYFADQGYTVTGSHPSYDWFYNRVNINQNLGFEDYKFMSNYYSQFTDDNVAMDRILMPEIVNLYKKHKEESDKPYFSFNVTYQGHGPYGTEQNFYGTDYVKSGVYTKETENILNNYFGSIADTNENLETLVDYYRNIDDPVVLVLFGDHKPWLGDNSSVYQELGIDLNYNDPDAGFTNYYTTRYVIWANDAAKKVLGNDFVGEGPDIGPYFLMNLLFRECGWKGPAYMQAIDEVSQAVPVISVSGLYIEDDKITNKLSKKDRELVVNYKCLEYYEQHHFRYDKK